MPRIAGKHNSIPDFLSFHQFSILKFDVSEKHGTIFNGKPGGL